jgi:aminomethyltransferase
MIETKATSEYSAVREVGAGFIDLSSRGRILVSGSEAVMFLNGLVTNDMKTLALNSWMPAAFANVQGRLLAVVRILHREDGFLIDTESVTREKVLGLLDRFTLAGDFRVTDLTSKTACVSVQGPRASKIVKSALGDEAASVERRAIAQIKLGNNQVGSAIRATHTAEDGFDLFVDTSEAQELRNSLITAGAEPVTEEVAETLRIEAGIPRYGIDMDETTIVTETNLDDAVSFTKGCYLGQEIIVRIKHRGHVAKKLTGIILGDGPIESGAKIMSQDQKEIGRVTSSTFSPRLARTIALGYLKYDYLAAGTDVTIQSNSTKLAGRVAELPFILGSWYTV